MLSIALADKNTSFNIVQIGVGGNGGYLTQRLSKMLYSFKQGDGLFRFKYTLVDGDRFERKNLLRQPCIEDDMGMVKSRVLAERYGITYNIPMYFRDTYIESVDHIKEAFGSSSSSDELDILIGCVDNHASRRIMHEYFHQHTGNILYIDSGISAYDESDPMSGYSGQVVCGLKLKGKLILESVGDLFEDVLTETESKLPTESCGDVVFYEPQRMITNEMAALTMAGHLNSVMGSYSLFGHVTYFNALTMLSRTEYITQEDVLLATN